jgi:hypothetical protein
LCKAPSAYGIGPKSFGNGLGILDKRAVCGVYSVKKAKSKHAIFWGKLVGRIA